MKIEYRVKPVTRYIVTRFESSGDNLSVGSSQIGNEYDTADVAYQVGYAVCSLEHQRLGWDIGDERIRYPDDPTLADVKISVDLSVGQGQRAGAADLNAFQQSQGIRDY